MKCIGFKRYESGCLQGFADIETEFLGKVILLKCKLFKKNGKAWASLPDHQTTNKEGEKIYVQNIFFKDNKDRHEVCEIIKKEIIKWVVANPEPKEEVEAPIFDDSQCPF